MILSVKVTDAMIERYYKYNSGGKKFTQVWFMVLEVYHCLFFPQIHTKHLTVTIDAFTIHNRYQLTLNKKETHCQAYSKLRQEIIQFTKWYSLLTFSLWLGKKTKLPDKKDLALVVWSFLLRLLQLLWEVIADKAVQEKHKDEEIKIRLLECEGGHSLFIKGWSG